ncbi:polysaccharide deacetylase [Pseudoramibacter alactolyticus ATCC 23263]|jgi:peptidoglycan/xylan/chitin deacetylase (PgdA/CDA1 family)|uniref:Polysaccharide deacetylase n=1 Tax=Pseudoramibacter alactolyticus ATCC 23263 TaxID=887929 RepID=E6MIR9_9FIRM|nr:polysaccharide deacetylase family protein [Pseudoramibacter alactolyticus]EFV01165.1 polysaccharide deacetylase [Pseudoramibacter alactolyticus ATCC 23263]MBM6967989.1 polysaccharide deacetylase [Pseudoramibacter alactolyticus]
MEIRKQWLAWVGFLGIIGVAAWLLWAASPRVLAAGHWEAFAKASGLLSDSLTAGEILQDSRDFHLRPSDLPGRMRMSKEKVLYLTFDDGPSKNTQPILDILNRYHAKATFFVTNQQPKYRHMIGKAYREGHTIGLHTSTHAYSIYRSPHAYFADLDAIAKTVKSEIGYVPCFVRFPGGSSNTISRNYSHGIMHVLTMELNKKGYQYYDWNGDSTDATMINGDPNKIAAMAKRSNDSNIVMLCHDTDTKSTTVKALPKIIEYYQAKGYALKAIDRKSFAPHHAINN